jgi:hypothetical protein
MRLYWPADLGTYTKAGHLKPFIDFLAGEPPTAEAVVAFAAHLHRLHQERRYAPATVNTFVAAAKRLVRIAWLPPLEAVKRQAVLSGQPRVCRLPVPTMRSSRGPR